MVKRVTLTYVLNSVVIEKLERAENLVVLGDQSTDINGGGVALRKIDEPGNLMGAIFAQYHDTDQADPEEADAFVQEFAPNPVEVRKKVIVDPHQNDRGDCGSRFQGDHGDTHLYDGFLLVNPDPEDIEEFFIWADDFFD